jgi:hypothetical protein
MTDTVAAAKTDVAENKKSNSTEGITPRNDK